MQLFILITIAIVLVSTHANIPPYIPKDMQLLMDGTVEPCHDFYKYSCGGWLKKHSLPPTQHVMDSSFTVIDKQNGPIFDEIIQESYPVVSELWESCVAFEKKKGLANKRLKKDLNRIIDAVGHDEVFKLLGEFSRTGTKGIFKITFESDFTDQVHTLLVKTFEELTMPHEYYTDENLAVIKDEYELYINKLLDISGFTSLAENKLILKHPASLSILLMEKKFAMSWMSRNSFVDGALLTDVTTKLPDTIGAYFKGMGIPQKEGLYIYTESVDYLDSLDKFFTSFSIDIFKHYVAFIMIHSRVEWLGDEYYQVWSEIFNQRIENQPKPPSRYNICMEKVVEYLPDLFGKYYYKKIFDIRREKYPLKMIKLIQESMGEHFKKSNWMDEDTVTKAQTKLSKVIHHVGQPSVPKSYPSTLSPTDYPSNVYTILLHAFDVQLKKLGQALNRMEWIGQISPTTLNVHCDRDYNSVFFPVAILQPPLFHGPKVHPARNFGAIGTLMGHELTHLFDNTGRFYDVDGSYREWWSEATLKDYEIRIQCLRKQYSEFQVDGEDGVMIGNVNGTLTLDENIADNGGVALAWDAYRKYMYREKTDTHGLTPREADKLFFLAYAQIWCTKLSHDNMIQSLHEDPHSPTQWRVNGVLMNNQDFVDTYNCEPETPMNSTDKCTIW